MFDAIAMQEILQQDLDKQLTILKDGEDWVACTNAANLAIILNRLDAMQHHAMPTVAHSAIAHSSSFELMEQAIEELQGAQTYYEQYQKAGDRRFLDMAKQELIHSYNLESMLREQGRMPDADTIKSKRAQLERQIR